MLQDAHSSNLEQRQGASLPLYATFPRRLNAISVDTVVLVLFSVLIFTVASYLERVDVVRITLVIAWWAVLLLYEPVLVWRWGGTVGHRAMNLRVVDNRSEGNVSLLKALARFVIKGLLGIFSFLTMNFSRRHQAVHDIVTQSSVRVRDATKARPEHYTLGRA